MVGLASRQPVAAVADATRAQGAASAADRQTEQDPDKIDRVPFDALAQQALLRSTFAPANDPNAPSVQLPKPAAAKQSADRKNGLLRRGIKTAIGLLLLVAVGWMPASRYFETGSVEAIVNARLVTIRAPIDGEVVAERFPLNVGSSIEPNRALFRIVNRRADRGSLNDVTRQLDLLESDRSIISARLRSLHQLHAILTEQSRSFQDGRVRQLEARMGEVNSNIAAASAKRQEAAANLERVSALSRQGIQSQAAQQRAVSEDAMATETEAALRKRLTAVEVELDAARRGLFVGDSYNDQPNSTQRATETEFRIRDLEAELAAKEERITRLKSHHDDEVKRYADRASAELAAPVEGRIWELLTAPGEEVRRGQDLLRVLDCSAAVVTTGVSEKVFNRLQLGDTAQVRIANANHAYEGKIIHLTGIASPPENLAIQPAALTREAFRVTVAVPGIKEACAVGRSGRVVFAPSDAPFTVLGVRVAGLFGR